MKRMTGRRAWRYAVVICLLLAACRSEEEGALRRYLQEAFGLERAPCRLSAAFVALDTIELTFAEARYNVGGLKKDGPYLFFKSIRFFPSLSQQGAEVTRLHLPSGAQDAIGRPDLGERAFVEGVSTYAPAADRLHLLGSTHLFEYALRDRSLVRRVRPQFGDELAPGRTSFFFRSPDASGAWLCPVGALNVHSFSPAYFAPYRPVLALLDRDGAMLRGIGHFPEAFRQGTFLHPPSLFVADLVGEELYLLFNSERTLRGKKRSLPSGR